MKRVAIVRKAPMARGTASLARRKRLRPANAARKLTEFQRAYGSRQRVAFVKQLACCVGFCQQYPSENAHTVTGGMGRKADASTIAPMCPNHHREQHAIGVPAFERRYMVNLAREAARTEALWQAHLATRAVA